MSAREAEPGAQTSRRALLGASLAGAALCACTAAKARASAAAPSDARAHEIFPELRDRSGELAPIAPSEQAARRARLAQLLPRFGLDAFLCEPGPTMTYLSGVSWGRSERPFALAVLADGTSLWLCPSFEAPKAELKLAAAQCSDAPIVTWEEHEYAYAPLRAALAARRAERLGLDPQLRLFIAEGLRAPGTRMARELLLELRGRKDAHELALLRLANELTQQALVAVAPRVHAGMTGQQIAELVHAAQRKLGLRDTWVLALVGAAAAYPHGEHEDEPLARGQALLVDTGGALHGYQSDETRTWVPDGRPSEELERVFATVQAAQQAAFARIRPGVRCREIDAAARSVIERAGYGSGYSALTHRLGHGIGLEGHEDPYFDGGSAVELQPGMTLSNEPGIYLYGRFGLRLEDIVAVTESGADHFGRWQRGLASPAG